MTDILRIAVCGAGSISREFSLNHFGERTGTKVAAVVDLNLERAQDLAADIGAMQAGVKVTTKGRLYQSRPTTSGGTPVQSATLLADVLDHVDAVYIGTTPTSHKVLVLQALAAGKHVLLEKPVAASAEDAVAIVAAAEEAGPALVVNIGMRYNDALKELRRAAVEEKQLGSVTGGELRLHFKQWPRSWQTQPWCANRLEGGALREVGTHFFFGLFELFGPESVHRVNANVVWPDGEGGILAESEVKGVLEIVPSRASNGGNDSSGAAAEPKPFQLAISVLTDGSKIHADGTDLYELELCGAAEQAGSFMLHGWTNLRGPSGKELVENADYGRKACIHGLRQMAGYPSCSAHSLPGITAREARAAQLIVDGLFSSKGEWYGINYN